MNPDKFLGISLIVFLAVAFFAIVIFAAGFGATRTMISDGAGTVGNYTANTTHWTGFSSTFTAAPLLIVIIFFGMIAYCVWRIVSAHVKAKA